MKRTITFLCDSCHTSCQVEAHQSDATCRSCGSEKTIGPIETFPNECPFCQCRQFYLSKDFNQTLGCLAIAIGIVLVPWTYGLSLPVLALADWILYQRVPAIANCYRCKSIFRGFDLPKNTKPFDHHIGILYDQSYK